MPDKRPAPEIVFRNAMVSRSGESWVPIAPKPGAEEEEVAAAKENKEGLQEHLKSLCTFFMHYIILI